MLSKKLQGLLRNRVFAVVSVAFVFWYIFFSREPGARQSQSVEGDHEQKLDLSEERKTFSNPIYDKGQRSFGSDVGGNCAQYFANFKDVPAMQLKTMVDLKYDSNVFKEKKWFRDREIALRRELRLQKIKFEDIHHDQIKKEFEALQRAVSLYEKQLAQDINHARIFGKCFVSDVDTKVEELCEAIEKKLYPWMSREYPKIEVSPEQVLPQGEFPNIDNERYSKYESAAEACFLRNLQLKSNGKGIVIPVSFGKSVEREVLDVIGLIRVLRLLKNDLPIQITYIGEYINDYQRNKILQAATTQDVKIQDSWLKYLRATGNPTPDSKVFDPKDFPPQKIWFVDLTPTINFKEHELLMYNPNVACPNFVHGLSMLFNTFEEAIIMSPHAIPLVKDISSHLFDLDSYKQRGHMFFKLPSKLSYRLEHFPSGYHEINSYIMNHLMPSDTDEKYFKVFKRQHNAPTTKRVFDDFFQRLLDPSLVVFNKSKAMSGVLISQNLMFHEEIRARFDIDLLGIAPEFLWLGQELAGTFDQTSFNYNFGVSVGMLTPALNKMLSEMQLSQELCSSSWGQVSDKDDILLLYVTSYQIENWRDVGYKFQSALEEKFIVMELKLVENVMDKTGDKVTIKTENKRLFKRLQQQPLYIDTYMRPPLLFQGVYVKDVREPNFAWKQSEHDIGDGYEYWCTYDVIGSHNSGVRGIIVPLNEKKVLEYKSLLDMWFHHEPEPIANQLSIHIPQPLA